jgi:carboxyl-terminal processing protease
MPRYPLFTASLLALALAAPGLAQDAPSHADFPTLADAINSTMHAHHYNPAELDSPAYLAVEQAVRGLAQTATTDEAFRIGFEAIWDDGPFSHVDLRHEDRDAEAITDWIDTLRIGGGGAALSWDGDIAVLTVNTMMGIDTIEEIDAAYDEIAAHRTAALIIDLRANRGGMFAFKPLVEHVLDAPLDIGVFVSQGWNAGMDRAPGPQDTAGVEPWTGWSIRDFWDSAQANDLTLARLNPDGPHYAGPVYVLVSERTASAAEIAADALQASGRATLIGEVTAGQMLSQRVYDMPGGFQLYLPIADYYSLASGRIEGVGLTPDMPQDADTALETALGLARP